MKTITESLNESVSQSSIRASNPSAFRYKIDNSKRISPYTESDPKFKNHLDQKQISDFGAAPVEIFRKELDNFAENYINPENLETSPNNKSKIFVTNEDFKEGMISLDKTGQLKSLLEASGSPIWEEYKAGDIHKSKCMEKSSNTYSSNEWNMTRDKIELREESSYGDEE
mmetsp:Transcript_14677/g.16390  ORF Transcript_14677/g.16390 Transcript_14677/m.16390 type:complete len:170 (+) Transcript_14677:1073-1582(+)